MLFRFSLYGFLKNQQYYTPFLVLAFLDKGLTFFQIGLLFGIKALFLNLFEVPSGAIADLYGRRRAMLFSFSVFILAFILLAICHSFWLLLIAMVFLALGDSFRTGTPDIHVPGPNWDQHWPPG
jgi:MFS family permease